MALSLREAYWFASGATFGLAVFFRLNVPTCSAYGAVTDGWACATLRARRRRFRGRRAGFDAGLLWQPAQRTLSALAAALSLDVGNHFIVLAALAHRPIRHLT